MRAVTAAEMREIDRRTIEEYGIPGLILMEHAGLAIANAAEKLVLPEDGTIAVVCGSGNNGGDGLVAARLLFNRGYTIHIYLIKPAESFTGDALTNYRMATALGITCQPFTTFPKQTSLIIDALLGTGTRGEVSGLYRTAIEAINAARKPVVAADIPSGLDADTGAVLGIAVKATVTVTMGLPKHGLLLPAAKPYVGSLIIADIGFPKALTE